MRKKRMLFILGIISILCIASAIVLVPATTNSQAYEQCCQVKTKKVDLRPDPINCKFNQFGVPNYAWYCLYTFYPNRQFCPPQEIFQKCYKEGDQKPICDYYSPCPRFPHNPKE